MSTLDRSQFEFVREAQQSLAVEFGRDPSDFGIVLESSINQRMGNLSIRFMGEGESPTIKSSSDTIKIGVNIHTLNDYGESTTLKVPVPKSF